MTTGTDGASRLSRLCVYAAPVGGKESGMIESFLSVGTQVLILFLMIGTGFVLGKLHLITHKGAVSMSNLLMYVVSPVSSSWCSSGRWRRRPSTIFG